MVLKANQIYRHFKGNLYRIITVATHTETEEELVIYQALYGDFKVYARPISMFISEVDKEKYPDVKQKMRFELLEQMVESVSIPESTTQFTESVAVLERTEQKTESVAVSECIEQNTELVSIPENVREKDLCESEAAAIDPMLEAYLDTDSYREKLNILHGLQHRITEHMLNTMAIVIDFELPEGDIQKKYDALNDCLMTKEKYECNRIF